MGKRTDYASLIGETYNRLTVTGIGKKDSLSHQYLICDCVCGNSGEYRYSQLKTGRTSSCGCYQKEMIGNLNKLPEGEAEKNRAFTIYKYAARETKREFFLTLDEFVYITKQVCHYCGALPRSIFIRKEYNGPGLVIRFSSKSYTLVYIHKIKN